MNISELEERLVLLVEGKVVSEKAKSITVSAFKRLINELDVKELEQAEMLFTHLPSALTRIEKGEPLEGPASEIISEIKDSEHFPVTESQVAFIEKNWEGSLPQEEKEFLYVHYTNVININKGVE